MHAVLFAGLAKIAFFFMLIFELPWAYIGFLVVSVIAALIGIETQLRVLLIIAGIAGSLFLVGLALGFLGVAAAGIGPGLFLIISGFALVPMVGMLVVTYLAFGFLTLGAEMILALLFYEISAESLPCGTWTIDQITPTLDAAGLRHGTTHEDPAALDKIYEWIRGKTESAKRELVAS